MKYKSRNFFIIIINILILSGCVNTPEKIRPENGDQLANKMNYLISAGSEKGDAFDYKFSDYSDCLSAISIKWPKWRLDDSNYSTATTLTKFDWREVVSISPEVDSRKRPPRYEENTHTFISINFSRPQPLRTTAINNNKEKYENSGFMDGLEIYFLTADHASTQGLMKLLFERKNICSLSPDRLINQDIASYTPEDEFEIGNAYFFSTHPAPKHALAYEWYEKAANGGNSNAQLRMGGARRSGLYGIQKDMVKARRWFEAAALQGSALASDMLGEMYEKGAGGLEADSVKAAYYYRIAAEQGVLTAQESLADMLEFGRGVSKDTAEAKAWYRKAAAGGSTSAHEALLLLEKNDQGK